MPSKTASKRGIDVALKERKEYASEEGTPSWKRKQRYVCWSLCSRTFNGNYIYIDHAYTY